MRRLALVITALLATGTAHAGLLDFGSMMNGANFYAINNFSAKSSDVEGAVLAGGNVNIGSYSINAVTDNGRPKGAYGNHALVAGGDVKLTGGSINGKMYAGGNVDLMWAATPERNTVNPVDFGALASHYLALSADLAKVQSTGTVKPLWSGVVVSGSGQGGVDVFNVTTDIFRSSSSWTLDKLVAGQTLIFNVSGDKATFNEGGISFEPLSGYNVLFNFTEALTLNPKGIIGSVLAPNASVNVDWGVVNGQVVVKDWNSTIQVNSNHFFKPVELSGFRDTPPVFDNDPAHVPEPGSLALVLAGLGVAVAMRRGGGKARPQASAA